MRQEFDSYVKRRIHAPAVENFLSEKLRKEETTMTNEYEVAAVTELGPAQDVVLGEKSSELGFDTLTQEQSLVYIEAMGD